MSHFTVDHLLDRILALEEKMNDMQTALNKLATKAQLTSVLNIRQNEIKQLQEEVESLKTQVAALQD